MEVEKQVEEMIEIKMEKEDKEMVDMSQKEVVILPLNDPRGWNSSFPSPLNVYLTVISKKKNLDRFSKLDDDNSCNLFNFILRVFDNYALLDLEQPQSVVKANEEYDRL